MFQIEVTHDGLNKYRLIKGSSADEVEMKAEMQVRVWDEMWRRKVEGEQRKRRRESEAEDRRRRREREAATKEQQLQLAREATKEAEDAIAEAQAILTSGLRDSRLFDWESLKDRAPFPKPKPVPPVPPLIPEKPDPSTIPVKPHPDDPKFQPSMGLLDGLIPGRKQRAIEEARAKYELALGNWEASVRSYNERVERHNRTLVVLKDQYQRQKANYYPGG